MAHPISASVIDGGVNGDVATCAITLNTIPQLLRANAGAEIDGGYSACFRFFE